MSISTLKIGLLSPAELQQLSALTREVRSLTGVPYSLLDPDLIHKLHQSLIALQADEHIQELESLAKSLEVDSNPIPNDMITVKKYRKYGVRVKYYDRPAA